MIRFSPLWRTSNGQPLDTSPLAEGTAFALSLQAEDATVVSVTNAPIVELVLPTLAVLISGVKVNGTAIDLDRTTAVAKTLTIDLQGLGFVTSILTIELVRQRALTFTLLRGALPPGLSVRADGLIEGVIENIPGDGTTTFDFTVRCSNGDAVKDRSFAIRATAVPFDTVWDLSSLPTEMTDDDLDIDYIPLGSFKRAETLSVAFAWFDQDGDAAAIEIRPTGKSGEFIEGLPSGVTINGDAIEGTIDPDITPGRYLFKMGFVGQATNTIYCEMIAEPELSTVVVEPQSVIRWKTPQGSLGSVYETYACEFVVTATAGELVVTYDLAPGSYPLPPGLTINKKTGNIQGFVAHVTADTVYPFTIRASTDGGSLDRTFSITVLNRFNTHNVLEARLRLRSNDRVGVRNRYRELVPAEARYRENDRNFGIPDPYVYLIKGLTGVSLDDAIQGDGTTGPFSESYHSSFPVLLGPHRSAVARDASGAVIYEVVYRMVIDRQAKAGGFSFETDEVVEEKVLWPQSGGTPRFIYPKSFRNARYDLARDLGFATDDPDNLTRPGLHGVEAMPTWMLSRQIDDDVDSVLGFIPALVVAFVKPGAAAPLLETLDEDAVLAPLGREVVFDRYFAFDYLLLVASTFDENMTTFDGGTTIFDPGATPE